MHDYFILGQLNLENEDYFNNELRCDEETNLCPDGFCCFVVWEQKQCISQELMIGGSCNDISSSSTTSTTTSDENDVIPDYLCDAQHPCPENFCCLSNLATCVSQVKIQLKAKLAKLTGQKCLIFQTKCTWINLRIYKLSDIFGAKIHRFKKLPTKQIFSNRIRTVFARLVIA